MTPELKSLCDRLQVLSGYLAAADEEEAFPIVDEAAAKLREMAGALEKARDQFAFYAREHRAAGKDEKAATNQRFADMLAAALSDAGEGSALDQPQIGEGLGDA